MNIDLALVASQSSERQFMTTPSWPTLWSIVELYRGDVILMIIHRYVVGARFIWV